MSEPQSHPVIPLRSAAILTLRTLFDSLLATDAAGFLFASRSPFAPNALREWAKEMSLDLYDTSTCVEVAFAGHGRVTVYL